MTDVPTCTIPAIDPAGDLFVFRLDVEPRTWKRPAPGGRRRHGGRHTDPADAAYRETVLRLVDSQLRNVGRFERPLWPEQPVAVEVVVAWPYPQDYDGGLPVRGDVDNYAKAIADALEGVAYSNDRQIATLTVARAYTDGAAFVDLTLAPALPTVVERDPEIETTFEEAGT